MKFLPITVLVIMASVFFVSWKKFTVEEKNKFHISGSVEIVKAYCGGVAPSPEMQRNSRIPFPQGEMTIYFRDGNSNEPDKHIIDSVTSDKQGNFSIDLPKGIYCIVEKFKTEPFHYPDDKDATWDTACYHESFKRCDFVLDVEKNMDSVNVIFARNCAWRNPCVKNYRGPRPAERAPGSTMPSPKDLPKKQ